MRIIPTNKYLLKCKIGETALCEFCTMEIETINHLFWECNYVQHFWANLATFLLRYNITMHFSLKYVTFGITERAHCIETQVKNFIILLGKYFIFKNKCLKTQPTISHFKVYLSQRINVENHIYFIKNRLAQFDTKWVNLKPLIEDNA